MRFTEKGTYCTVSISSGTVVVVVVVVVVVLIIIQDSLNGR